MPTLRMSSREECVLCGSEVLASDREHFLQPSERTDTENRQQLHNVPRASLRTMDSENSVFPSVYCGTTPCSVTLMCIGI